MIAALPEQVLQPLRAGRVLAERMTFRPYVTEVRLVDRAYRFLIADRSSQSWYTAPAQRHNRHFRWLVERMLAPGDVVLQCGAHHGFSTLPLATRVGPRGAVYCVEPHPRNAAIIGRNAALNGLSNIHPVVRAVAGYTGGIRLLHGSHTSVPATTQRGQPGFRARASTLDDLVEELGIRPDLVVLDIGGMELEALRAAPKLVASRPRWAIEVHPRDLQLRGQAPADLLPYLAPARLFVVAADGRGGSPIESLPGGTLPDIPHELYALPWRVGANGRTAGRGPGDAAPPHDQGDYPPRVRES